MKDWFRFGFTCFGAEWSRDHQTPVAETPGRDTSGANQGKEKEKKGGEGGYREKETEKETKREKGGKRMRQRR